ncbi:MAG: hypothetical protein IPL65_08530 [Lewinellaceae bacterium]|nr:hypothetical protein [Lewinellaceae bacterium]
MATKIGICGEDLRRWRRMEENGGEESRGEWRRGDGDGGEEMEEMEERRGE